MPPVQYPFSPNPRVGADGTIPSMILTLTLIVLLISGINLTRGGYSADARQGPAIVPPVSITPDEALQRLGAWAVEETGAAQREVTSIPQTSSAVSLREELQRIGAWAVTDAHVPPAPMTPLPSVDPHVIDALRRIGSWTTVPVH